MEEEKGANSNVNTRSKRITKDSKAPAQRGGRKAAAADDDGEDSQVSTRDTAFASILAYHNPTFLGTMSIFSPFYPFFNLVYGLFRVMEKTRASALKRDQSKRSSRR